MEGLSKLKELEYINAAVNNISLIEGIRGCESLQKLDLTLNFIDIEDFEESVDNLAEVPDFREIYLTGNPCTDWPHWKEYLMARLDTLGRIDGDEVTKSMRMKAKQNLKQMEKELTIAARRSIEKKIFEEKEGIYKPNGYTKEFRRECYLEKKIGDAKREKDRK
jgi:protein TilB